MQQMSCRQWLGRNCFRGKFSSMMHYAARSVWFGTHECGPAVQHLLGGQEVDDAALTLVCMRQLNRLLSLYLTHPKILLTRNNNIFCAYTSISDTFYAYADLEDVGYTRVGSNAVRTNTMWLLRLMLHYIIKKGNVDGKKKKIKRRVHNIPCHATQHARPIHSAIPKLTEECPVLQPRAAYHGLDCS